MWRCAVGNLSRPFFYLSLHSQALARLRWSDEVVSGDVDEAIRLMMMSKVIMAMQMIILEAVCAI